MICCRIYLCFTMNLILFFYNFSYMFFIYIISRARMVCCKRARTQQGSGARSVFLLALASYWLRVECRRVLGQSECGASGARGEPGASSGTGGEERKGFFFLSPVLSLSVYPPVLSHTGTGFKGGLPILIYTPRAARAAGDAGAREADTAGSRRADGGRRYGPAWRLEDDCRTLAVQLTVSVPAVVQLILHLHL